MRLASNPKSIVFMGFSIIWIVKSNNLLLDFLHELETELTILENYPASSFHTGLDCSSSRLLLSLSHRDFLSYLLFLSSEIVN